MYNHTPKPYKLCIKDTKAAPSPASTPAAKPAAPAAAKAATPATKTTPTPAPAPTKVTYLEAKLNYKFKG